jgi:hypothetical protein
MRIDYNIELNNPKIVLNATFIHETKQVLYGAIFNNLHHRLLGYTLNGVKYTFDVSTDDIKDYFRNLDLSNINTKGLITPPTLSPYAVVIPEIYQWAFPENKFVLSGFEIPLDTINGVKCVNLAYFNWQAFRDELDSGNYVALKRSLMELWDYVKFQADTIGPWMQDPQNNQLSDKVIIV